MPNPTPFTAAKLIPFVIGAGLIGLLGATLFSALSGPTVNVSPSDSLQKNILPDGGAIPLTGDFETPEQKPYEQGYVDSIFGPIPGEEGYIEQSEINEEYDNDYEELMVSYHDNSDNRTDYDLEPRYQHLPIADIDDELTSLEAKMDILIEENDRNPSLNFEENMHPYVERFEALLQLRLQKTSELEAQRVAEHIANIKNENVYNIPPVENLLYVDNTIEFDGQVNNGYEYSSYDLSLTMAELNDEIQQMEDTIRFLKDEYDRTGETSVYNTIQLTINRHEALEDHREDVITNYNYEHVDRTAEARNTQRKVDVHAILSAVYQYIIDNNGATPGELPQYYQSICVKGGTACTVELYSYLEPYLIEMPRNPQSNPSSDLSGYLIQQDLKGVITIAAAFAENDEFISASR